MRKEGDETVRDILLRLTAMKNRQAFEDLVGPPLIPLFARTWRIFADLLRRRPVGLGGVSKLSYVELWARTQLRGEHLTEEEFLVLDVFDDVFCEFVSEELEDTAPDDTEDSDGDDHSDDTDI